MYNILDPKDSYCIIGDQCNFHSKGIGLTLNDILHEEFQMDTALNDQSLSIRISAAFTIIMFVGSLINSVLSFITFKAKDAQKVGCGMYLLASSITSFFTISMFVVKFWFVVLTEINMSTSLSVLRAGCVSIETVLKLCFYSDTWLNACVAIERAIHVYKGVHFDKKKSKRAARWIIIILPFCIMTTLLHEPIYRDLFEYQATINKTVDNETYVNGNDEDSTERFVSCVTRYSPSVQDYDTVILFFHFVVPFITNLFSALFIISGAARQRSVARTGQTFIQHVREQFSEHKQLIISPFVLLVLSIPRLIISILPGCVKTSELLWMYLAGYFISFTPSMLIFMIFVFPSELYMKIFKESLSIGRR